MLTDNQKKYLQDICRNKKLNVNFNMTTADFNEFIQDNTHATEKQIHYIKTLCGNNDPLQYINTLDIHIDNLQELTMRHTKKILNALKTEKNIVNTQKINFDLYQYKYDLLERDYLIGTQINNSTGKHLKVMCFYNMMVIDWDNISLDQIKELLKNDRNTWYIYKTYNGYHGYCMSKKWEHYKNDTLLFMQKMSCDPIYISFVKSVGFIIRIQKKENRNEAFIEEFSCKINDFPILPRLSELMDIKDNIIL